MIKLILKISPLVLLLVLQGCSDEYCCNIPGIDAIAGACSDGISTDQEACETGSCSHSFWEDQEECVMNGYTWNDYCNDMRLCIDRLNYIVYLSWACP